MQTGELSSIIVARYRYDCSTRYQTLTSTIGTIVPLGYDGRAACGPTTGPNLPREPASRDLYHLLTTRDVATASQCKSMCFAMLRLKIRDYEKHEINSEVLVARTGMQTRDHCSNLYKYQKSLTLPTISLARFCHLDDLHSSSGR